MSRKKLPVKMPYRFAGHIIGSTCIYKLSFNDHFFIGGTSQLYKRMSVHSVEIDRRLRLGPKPNDIYAKLLRYIQKNDVKEFVVETLFAVDKASDIPLFEQKMFDLVRDNPKCLNVDFDAHKRLQAPKKKKVAAAAEPAPAPKQKKQPGTRSKKATAAVVPQEPVPGDQKSLVVTTPAPIPEGVQKNLDSLAALRNALKQLE